MNSENKIQCKAITVKNKQCSKRAIQEGELCLCHIGISEQKQLTDEDDNEFKTMRKIILKGTPQDLKNLLDSKANPNSRDNKETLLYYAVRVNNYEAVKLLVEYKASVNDKNPNKKMTPLCMASYRKYDNMVKLLLENKADIGYSLFASIKYSNDGNTLKILLEAKGQFDMKNREGETPLDMARKSIYKLPIVSILENAYDNRLLDSVLKQVHPVGEILTVENIRPIIPLPTEGGHIALFNIIVGYVNPSE